MANIQVLDQITIDKIAAGEVISIPAGDDRFSDESLYLYSVNPFVGFQ